MYELLTRSAAGDARKPHVLFVHGGFHAAWCWNEHWMSYFAERGYGSTALSIRGHGASGGTYHHARLRDYVDDVSTVLAGLPAPPVLIGHSMGGSIVQHLLTRNTYPAAILAASTPRGGVPFHVQARSFLRHPWVFVRTALTLDARPMVETDELVREHFFSPRMPAADIRGIRTRLIGESFLSILDLRLHRPKRPLPATPILVLAAACDASAPVSSQRRMATDYGAAFAVIAESGHDIMLDINWRRAAEVACDWLDSLALPG